jgi:hypothetical protein
MNFLNDLLIFSTLNSSNISSVANIFNFYNVHRIVNLFDGYELRTRLTDGNKAELKHETYYPCYYIESLDLQEASIFEIVIPIDIQLKPINYELAGSLIVFLKGWAGSYFGCIYI